MLWYKTFFILITNKLREYILDEATQEQTNSSLSTNEIIEDTQSAQEDMNRRGTFSFYRCRSEC